jgi:S-adenosylmethionine:tRNA ribosyltransferase-isomerase
MKLSDFDFTLPEELIAQTPIFPRNNSKMLLINNEIIDSYFKFFIECVNPKDIVIFNDSKVIPAYLEGFIDKKLVRLNLHKHLGENRWLCFAKKTKSICVGNRIIFGDGFSALVMHKNFGELELEFEYTGDFYTKLTEYGKLPLPMYIKSYSKNSATDYQTVYAKDPGSFAAPTAGLHFTEDIIEELSRKANIGYITLHVGAGTFLPVKNENISEHKMHSEDFIISAELKDRILASKAQGGRVIAIGTTSLRALEAHFGATHERSTDIFITPGYKFKIVDMLLTNFHLPKSTLFMLVCAFSGINRMKKAYEHAIKEKYRFFSYGDCCLLSRNNDDNI